MPTPEQLKPSRVYLRRGHPINRGLALAWPLFEGAGTTVRDISPWAGTGEVGDFGTQGTVSGGTWNGLGVDLNGSGDSIEADNDPLPHSSPSAQTFSLAVWFKPDSTSQGEFTGVFSSGSVGGFNFQIDFDGSQNYRYTGSSTYTFGAASTTLDCIVITWSKEQSQITGYLNGEQSFQSSDSESGDFDGTMALGVNRGDSAFFDGTAYGLMLWDNYVLSATQARELNRNPMIPYITKPR